MAEELDFSNLDSLATPCEPVSPTTSEGGPAAVIVPPESYTPQARTRRSIGIAPMLYNPKLAKQFFSLAGQEESIPAGAQIFAEDDKPSGFFSKGAKVYLLLDGEVELTVKGRHLSTLHSGETFGELAVISAAPRSATATARKDCTLLALDEKRFLKSFQQVPEFVLMLISIMMQRLQLGFAHILASNKSTAPRAGLPGLSPGELKALCRAMGDPAPTPMRAGDAIVAKGSLGALMFVLVSGQVSTALEGRVVEHLGPGGIFGERAMLGPSVRGATVTADTDGYWLPMSQGDFLDIVKTQPAVGVALLRSLSERILATNTLLHQQD